MATFTIQADGADATRKVQAIRNALTRTKMDSVTRKVAYVTLRRLVQRTPKKWTGHTRRSWRVFRTGAARYSVTNLSNVMLFLEKGTRAHGPKKAKRLFIPLTRRAALAGASKVVGSFISGEAREGGKRPYKPGKDFVLARRVRGIKAMRIVESHRPFAHMTLKAEMRLHIRNILSSF